MLNISNVILADAGVWYAFSNSDGMGKAIVFLLFISSMVAWFIMIEKGLALYRSQKLSERFAANFNSQHGMQSMLREGMDNPCPVARVYISGMEQLLEFYGQKPEDARTAIPSRNKSMHKLSSAQLDAIQTAMEREISGQIFVIEERIGMLATAVSLAPFLGLFGTVWGVMIAFCGVASAGSANIQALAPGVAGALLTTVAGLIVAIPSLIGYNLLTQMIRKITVSMDNFSESFMAQLKLEQLAAREAENIANRNAAAQTAAQTAAQHPANAPQSSSAQSNWSNRPMTQAAPAAAGTGSWQNRQYSTQEHSQPQPDNNRQMTFTDLSGDGNYPNDSARQ